VSEPFTTTIDDGVVVVTLDDGKMTALGHQTIDHLHASLDLAEKEAAAWCLVGSDRALCAGFDLAVMTGEPAGMRDLVRAGGELLGRLYVHPQPTVIAVTGHALAAGALMLLAADTRIAAGGKAKIGLNEVAIGLPLPTFAMELATARLSKRALTRAAVQAEIFDADGALAVGYVDAIDADCRGAALAEARRLGALPGFAYGTTKVRLRQPTADRIIESLTELDAFGPA
jgi:enoyl-CoA hydratase